MTCNCTDWKENIDLLNGPIVDDQLCRGVNDFLCKQFTHCPWCGTKLIKEKEKDVEIQEHLEAEATMYKYPPCKLEGHLYIISSFGKKCVFCEIPEEEA